MSFSIGNNIHMEVRGTSHSEQIEMILSGIPGEKEIDFQELRSFMDRRRGGQYFFSTSRVENDWPEVIEGLEGNISLGKDIYVSFSNRNIRRNDYNLRIPRPSHADFAAIQKYGNSIDLSGGGFFSGRMTLPLCFAGGICCQILRAYGVKIGTHISSIGKIHDKPYDAVEESIEKNDDIFPVLDRDKGLEMLEFLKEVYESGNSAGGTVECKIIGMKPGVGDPIYDSLESKISHGIFGIPAIKAIEFGGGFGMCEGLGSEYNDGFCIKNDSIKCITNYSGGLQGGLTNGMPIIFRVGVKPVPSISKPQKSVDLITMEETELKIRGRHDSCIVPRILPCIEAMTAIVILDELYDDMNFSKQNHNICF